MRLFMASEWCTIQNCPSEPNFPTKPPLNVQQPRTNADRPISVNKFKMLKFAPNIFVLIKTMLTQKCTNLARCKLVLHGNVHTG